MQTNRFTFLSSNMRDTIYAREWIPDGEVRAVLQLAHGMLEYMKNYERFAEFMCEHGFYVIGMDCLGHGDSAQAGELGYFNDPDSSEFIILDMRTLTEKARERYAGLTHIMCGHSFGSFLTRIYISRYRDIDGAVLIGSGDMDVKAVDRLMMLIKIHRRRHTGLYRSKLIQAAAFGRRVRRFLPMKNNFEWTSRDRERIREYVRDPKNNYVFTLNGFQTLFATVLKAQEESTVENIPKNLPVLIVSGENDAIGEYGKGIRRVHKQMLESGMKKTTLMMYDDARHNILQDICYMKVQSDILDWCAEIAAN